MSTDKSKTQICRDCGADIRWDARQHGWRSVHRRSGEDDYTCFARVQEDERVAEFTGGPEGHTGLYPVHSPA